MQKKKRKSKKDEKSGTGFFSSLITGVLLAPFFFVYYLLKWIFIYGFGLNRTYRRVNRELKRIDKMTGREFELYLADLFSRKGYRAEATKATGDYGADLLLRQKGVFIVVQAKLLSAGRVPSHAIAEVHAARAHYAAEEAWVVTNRTFSAAARSLAKSTSVTLLDRQTLTQLLK